MDRSIGSRVAALALLAIAGALPTAAQPAAGALSLGLAGAVTARGDLRTALLNPAAAIDTRGVADAAERLYATTGAALGGLAGLADALVLATRPLDSGRLLLLSLGGHGYGSYRMVAASACVAQPVAPALDAGAALRVEAQSIDGYGLAGSLMLDVGAILRAAPGIRLGAAARNVTGSRLRGLPRPQEIALGLLASLGDSIDVAIDLLHTAGRGATICCGVSLGIAGGFELRGGLRGDGSLLAAGFGFESDELLLDGALAWGSAMGPQLAIGVGTRW